MVTITECSLFLIFTECQSYRSYSEEDYVSALWAIAAKEMSKKAAARHFGVPRTTLVTRVYNKTPTDRHASRPYSVLSRDEESLLADWAIKMSRAGFPITSYELQYEVKKILDADGRPNPFKDNQPGTMSSIFMFMFFLLDNMLSLQITYKDMLEKCQNNFFRQYSKINSCISSS